MYFETDAGDGFREPGFSKERRLEPQITIGLLTNASGFPLMVNAFEGNRAETTTMLPVIHEFMKAHRLADVTIVADAGMVSDANKRALEAEGLSFILGARVPDIRYVVKKWHQNHPDSEIPDGHVFTQPWPAARSDKRRDQIFCYQYRADRARRTLRGIDEQVAKAEKAVQGKASVKRNRFVHITGGTKKVNRELETKARALAGIKGHVTNLDASPEFVIDAYHGLFNIEKSFRMSKSDLAARPIYHHKRDSIEAHLTIVFAALTVSRGSRTPPAGRSRSSSAPPAATAPSKSRPAPTPSPPPTRYPTTCTRSCKPSTATTVRTNLAQVRYQDFGDTQGSWRGPRGRQVCWRCTAERCPTRAAGWGLGYYVRR